MFENFLVEKYRPKTLDEIVLSKEHRIFFQNIKNLKEIPHLLFVGAAGIGKSSLAKIITNSILDCQYLYVNASDESGIDTIRNKISNFVKTKSFDGKLKVIILDEFCGITTIAQKALKNLMEEYSSNCRFILTVNSLNNTSDPIRSRCQIFELNPPFKDCVDRCVTIIKQENIKVPSEQKKNLLNLMGSCYPDLRKMINTIQKYSINNVLNIPKDLHTSSSIAKDIFDKLTTKEDIIKIRKFVIDNEVLFNNDFHGLLKELFEVVYEYNVGVDNKKKILLIISEALFKHQTVLDKEINCFAALIEISEVLK